MAICTTLTVTAAAVPIVYAQNWGWAYKKLNVVINVNSDCIETLTELTGSSGVVWFKGEYDTSDLPSGKKITGKILIKFKRPGDTTERSISPNFEVTANGVTSAWFWDYVHSSVWSAGTFVITSVGLTDLQLVNI